MQRPRRTAERGAAPTALQSVLNSIARTAARLCEARDARITLLEGDHLRLVAFTGAAPVLPLAPYARAVDRRTPAGHAMLDRRVVHVRDMQVAARRQYTAFAEVVRGSGMRTVLVAPLLCGGGALGAILVRRDRVKPFTAKQISLLEAFADQAAIAIENARLSEELGSRNRELTAALEQQTASSEILKAISGAQTDATAVFESIARSAVRLCGAFACRVFRAEGEQLPVVGEAYGTPEARVLFAGTHSEALGSDSPSATAIRERRVVHYADVPNDPDVPERYRERARARGYRALMAVPMVRDGVALGSIAVARQEPVPFPEHHVELLKTFADQAVIAIENVRLFTELQVRNHELSEALEQQTATSEILRAISSSPTDLQPVFDIIARNAAHLCGGLFSCVSRFDGELIHMMSLYNYPPEALEVSRRRFPAPLGPQTFAGRTILERDVVHVPDILADQEARPDEMLATGFRSVLSVPLLRGGQPIGAITVWRAAVGRFADTQVGLLQTFAEQAIIAIENVRLFRELEARNTALTEALEQQTATAEILRVISASPTNTQPVFDAILDSATRLCAAEHGILFHYDGEAFHTIACRGLSAEAERTFRAEPARPGPHSGLGRMLEGRRPVQVADVTDDIAYRQGDPLRARTVTLLGARTAMWLPLLKSDGVVGAMAIYRREMRPFSDKQVELVATFADQAVIAIENVRLFRELEARNAALTETLSQQTATAEILRVISSSPTDTQPVFDAILDNAIRLCDGHYGGVYRFDGTLLHQVVVRNLPQEARDYLAQRYPATPFGLFEVAFRERRIVHTSDLLTDARIASPQAARDFVRVSGVKAMVVAPMLRDDTPIGVIVVTRREGRFSDKQLALLQTFADQAVIAIENVRLFTELQARNRELTEALEQQTATGDILRVISSSPIDAHPVFDAIAASAMRLCNGVISAVYRFDGERIHFVASTDTSSGSLAAMHRVYPILPDRSITISAQTILDRRVVHFADVEADPSVPDATRMLGRAVGFRALVSVPMLREGQAVGAIQVARRDPVAFSDKQIELLQTFADQAVIAIENVRLFTELQARTQELTRSVQQLTALGEVGQAVSSTLDLETVLNTIVSRAVQLTGSDGGTIFEYDESTEQFHQRATERLSVLLETEAQWRDVGDLFRPWANALRSPLRIKKGEGVVGRLPETRKPIQVSDIAAVGAYEGPLRDVLLESGIRAVLTVPLLREDRLVGALTVNRKTAGAFSPEVVALLTTFAAQSAIAIQNARLFREIEAKGRELELASRHKSQFLANMSHELRTPMNAILGYTELIADGIYGDVPDRMREVVERVGASGRHLLGLINDVLDLSKIEAGQLTLTLADYSMKEVVEAVGAAVEGLAAEKRLRLIVDLAPALPTGRGDQRRLAQVLLNLVGNAIKFTEQGHVAIRVGVAAGLFTVAVSDTGAGIAPADQERIFEEFQQADTSTTRPKGGTGLGLAIARRIVAMHGGRIWVESAPGEGATFRITMPVRVEQQAVVREGTS